VQILKETLTRIGSHCSERTVHRLNAVVNYLEVGRWLHERGLEPGLRLESREEVFAAIAADVRDRQVLYLEFGVFQGDSMRTWSRLLRNPRSRLHGFDSFEGLPERWSIDEPEGHFSTAGEPPEFSDPRVELFKGWFEDTLPRYEPPEHEVLVVNIDSDVYSSAALVLDHLAPWLRSRSYLYFDEFNERVHELRAFDEFLRKTAMQFELVAASAELRHVAFRRTG
jgi:hypothetical protein